MQTRLLLDHLKAIGFKVSNDGIMSEGVFDFGVLRMDGIVDVNGVMHEFGEFRSIEYNEGAKILTVHTEDGESLELTGGSIRNDYELIEEIHVREIPLTTATFDSVFEELFPGWRSQLYYDELKERDTIDLAMLGEEGGEVPINDTIVALYHRKVEQRLAQCGFFGKRMVSRETMDEVLSIRLFGNSRNHFREKVESIEWDGTPRLHTYFQDAFGATAPALDKDEEAVYLGGVAEAWFVGGIARMYHPTQLDVVPVLIGGQGAGKTRSLRYTAMDDMWYGSTAVDISAPGGVESFLDAARGKVILEMGEATQLRSKDAEKLKQFISQDVDSMRKKYEKHNSDYPRHFILAATTNIDNLFSDMTGNRRYFSMVCEPRVQTLIWSVSDRSVGNEHIEQVWAEALQLYRDGATPNVSKDVMSLAKKQQDFNTKENPAVSLIDRWLDENYAEKGDRITKQIVMEGLFGYNKDTYIKDAEQMWSAWCNGNVAWKKVPPFRIKGKTYRGYERVLRPGQEPEVISFNMVDSEDDPTLNNIRLQALFRKLNRRFQFYEGGPFPMDAVTPEQLEHFRSLGYIYNRGLESKPDYRVAYLP